MTSTDSAEITKELRLPDREQELAVAAASTLSLPLQTRIALLVLLGGAIFGLAYLVNCYLQAPAATVVQAQVVVAKEMPKQAAAQESAPAKVEPAAKESANQDVLVALAEVELIATLAKEDPKIDLPRALSRLKHYAGSSDEQVKAAALKAQAPLLEIVDGRARTAARAAAESATELAESGDFPGALQKIEAALNELPNYSPWAMEHGATQLQALSQKFGAQRTETTVQALKEYEEAFNSGDAGKIAKASAWLQHRDPAIRTAVEKLKEGLESKLAALRTQRQQTEARWRGTWTAFFTKLSSAIAEGDLDLAERLCKPMPQDPLFDGGVSNPQKVLQGFLSDIDAIRNLREVTLQLAKNGKRNVSLPMRRGKVEGVMDGSDGKQLQVSLPGGAKVGVKIENLTAAGLMSALDSATLANPKVASALWILSAHENPNDAYNTLPRAFANVKEPLPEHWAERFKIERFKRIDAEVGAKLSDLNSALETNEPEKIKAALDALRPAVTALEEYEPLSEARKKVIDNAEKIVGKAAKQRVVLQNGISPADYTGITTDQISQYKDSARKTDVGVQYGLKLGISGGVHRALVKFEGIEAAVGKAKLKKATLEFYQIESPQSAGTVIALFRLKRAWTPDAGTWMSYDSAKNLDWAIPGASGDADISSNDDAKVSIDKLRNQWRSFDVTQYVQDVLSGKQANFGFLMKVINGEPEHQVRFVPETDTEIGKDKSLRPKLILELEQE